MFCVFSDVDECVDPVVCGTALCENTNGSYNCLCDIGYQYDNDTKTCVGEYTGSTYICTFTFHLKRSSLSHSGSGCGRAAGSAKEHITYSYDT